MSMEATEGIRQNLMNELVNIEGDTDLSQMTILSRAGLRIATASSFVVDADPISASSTALIDVGTRFVGNLSHGNLREILIKGNQGYAVLMHIDLNFMMFAQLSNLARIGFYLEYLRIKCKLFSYILAGGVISAELQKELEAESKKQSGVTESFDEMFESDVSNSQDMDSMADVLDFLNDWGGDDVPQNAGEVSTGIVGIGDDFMIGTAADEMEAFLSDTKEEMKTEPLKNEIPSVPNFKLYPDEVPPIPLDDVEALEISSESSGEYQYSEQNTTVQTPNFAEGEEPNFESFSASEYEDVDLDLSEEDAMFEALSDLGYTDKKKKK
ncbi:MAG: hypothetical protein GY870_12930 [archaeon]|nr:hypothetical protein [archaeon]